MPLIRGASALVIRCFRRVEVVADVLTGAAGPVFVVLAWVLTGLAGTVFFDVVARDLPLLPTLLLLPAYILVPLNLYGQYWLVTHVSPGHPRPQNAKQAAYTHPDSRSLLAPERWGWERERVPSPLLGARRRVRRCRKCDGPKPERSHHCKVCKRCVLLMDHHCPWINGCVGLHNQRHFVLFMAWLSIGCWFVLALGYGHFWRSLDFRADWPAYSPKVAFTLSYILAVAIGIAVPVLGGWHMYMVARGETSIEGHDNDYLEKRAKKSGLVYLNPYDMGRRRNLEIFFNIGPGGYPATTLLFPLVVPPYSNGWSWPRRAMPTTLPAKPPQPAQPGYEAERGDGPGGVYLMGNGDEMTDDEEGDAGFWDPQGVERREE